MKDSLIQLLFTLTLLWYETLHVYFLTNNQILKSGYLNVKVEINWRLELIKVFGEIIF